MSGRCGSEQFERLFNIIWNMPNSAIPQSNFDEDSYGDGAASNYVGNSYNCELMSQSFV